MTQCEYCGQDFKNVKVHARFCKYKPKEPNASKEPEVINTIEQAIKEEIVKPVDPKRSFLSRVFRKKELKQAIEVTSPKELIEGLKPYQIPQSNPKAGFIGKITKRNKDFIQVVLVSELIEPKMFWAEKTGMNRIQCGDRMYVLPRDIRGNVFFWHVDKKQALIDSAQASQTDGEDSFHELQIFNQGYMLGIASCQDDPTKSIKLIVLLVGFMCLLVIGTLGLVYSLSKSVNANDAAILNAISTLNNTIYHFGGRP